MSDTRVVHDSGKLLADLREHLAGHDKPIGFLFGAGTSCAVRVVRPGDRSASALIPDVQGLTSQCETEAAATDPRFGPAWKELVARSRARREAPNIENLLSRLMVMRDAIGPSDHLAGLDCSDLRRLETTVRQTIARLVNPDVREIPAETPHREVGRWLVRASRKHPAEIFTVNYDVLLERALEAERVPIFDGFVGTYEPFFHADSLRHADAAPGNNWTRLWKLHGSVTWHRVEEGRHTRVVRGTASDSGEMIFPSLRKYDESRQQPYSAFMDRLARFLELEDALLIAAGFSFGDEHINNLIFEALENLPRTHVYALQYEDPKADSDLLQRSIDQPNLIVVGPRTGVVGGRFGEWKSTQDMGFHDAGLNERHSRPDGADARSGVGTGAGRDRIVRIGDFSCFCRFLRSLA